MGGALVVSRVTVAVTRDSAAALVLPSPGRLPRFPRWGQLFVRVEKSLACEGTALCRAPLGLVCPERWAEPQVGCRAELGTEEGQVALFFGEKCSDIPHIPLGSVLTATGALSSWADLDPGGPSTPYLDPCPLPPATFTLSLRLWDP